MLVDKPVGLSSFAVVAIVRRKLSQHYNKKMKVGHTGTLDPFASGLMILVIGKECKNAANYSKLDKVYEATMVLGHTSSTGDVEGELTHTSDIKPTLEQLKDVMAKFVGEIEQQPPRFSAIKINGQRAYKLARAGKEFEMPTRKVTVHSLELIDYVYPEVKFRVHVSSGTYIRTLAEDIGAELSTGAYCKSLRRLSISYWQVSDAFKVEA